MAHPWTQVKLLLILHRGFYVGVNMWFFQDLYSSDFPGDGDPTTVIFIIEKKKKKFSCRLVFRTGGYRQQWYVELNEIETKT